VEGGRSCKGVGRIFGDRYRNMEHILKYLQNNIRILIATNKTQMHISRFITRR
jgi:hypothetical protein